MGFGQGLSGLNAAAQSLDVIGNNIANSGTVGFKSATASFADVYASSRVGLGVQVSGVNQRFTVGNVKATGGQFDIAIDGEQGLFRLQDASGALLYSRNGEFFADKNNYIVNAQGQRLTGYLGGADSATLGPLMVPTGNIAPMPTTAATTKANLDANAPPVAANHPFSATDAQSYTHSLPIQIYDSLGNAHQMVQYFIKREGAKGTHSHSRWDVHYTLDGAPVDSPAGGGPVQMTFDKAGRMTSAAQTTVVVNAPGNADAPAERLEINLDYAGSTQFGGDFTPSFTQNGYATGEYAGLSISADGEVVASYTNGQSQAVGIVALADFKNMQGLQPAGGNAWIETAASGAALIGRPGANGMASLKGQALEESNVDMSQELVNMIIAQRAYQANAQTIKTYDQVLQTLITMR